MINIEKLELAGINYRAGLERFMNDEELYEAVLNAFVSESILPRAQKAFNERNMSALLQAVHEAKGASGNAGFERLYKQTSALVDMLRSDDYTDEALGEAFERFKFEYVKVEYGIKDAIE